MPSGQNVVRMVHCTQLQHVKPTGGIFKHGLKTRRQLRMEVKPWQSWLGGGDERYLGRGIEETLSQAQGGVSAVVVVDLDLGNIMTATRRPNRGPNPYTKKKLEKKNVQTLKMTNSTGTQQWATIGQNFKYVFMGPIAAWKDDGAVPRPRFHPYHDHPKRVEQMRRMRAAFESRAQREVEVGMRQLKKRCSRAEKQREKQERLAKRVREQNERVERLRVASERKAETARVAAERRARSLHERQQETEKRQRERAREFERKAVETRLAYEKGVARAAAAAAEQARERERKAAAQRAADAVAKAKAAKRAAAQRAADAAAEHRRAKAKAAQLAADAQRSLFLWLAAEPEALAAAVSATAAVARAATWRAGVVARAATWSCC